MNKFKVGDPVKALVSTPWWREGDAGVIVPNPDGGFKVAIEDGGTWWFCDDEESMFELVEPKVHITGGGTGGGAFAGRSGGITRGHGSSRLADNKLFYALKKDCLFGGNWVDAIFDGIDQSLTIYPNPPHIHKDLIIAWANGADIEVGDGDGVFYETSKPEWIDTLEYRTAPTKTPLQLKIEKCEAKLIKLKGQL